MFPTFLTFHWLKINSIISNMKNLVFNATEATTAKTRKSRKFISRQLQKESKLVQEESMKVLAEFEKLYERE
jgi:hypothetical protein